MSFTLRQLRYFVSAAETGKLSSAASECNVSQSAITLAIKSLEDQIGFELFERNPHGVTLSREGQRFLGKSREILSLAYSAASSSLDHPTSANRIGRIKVGATDTVMGYFLIPLIARFRARFPQLKVDLVEMERPEIENALVEEELDLGILLVSNVQRQGDLACSVLLPSQRRLWLPSNHPLLSKHSATLKDVAKEPLIMLTVDEAEHTARSYWEIGGLQPNVVMRSANVEAVRTAVASGLGVALLSDMVYRPWSLDGSRIEVREIQDSIPSMDIGVAQKLGKTLSPSAQEFWNFLTKASGQAGRLNFAQSD